MTLIDIFKTAIKQKIGHKFRFLYHELKQEHYLIRLSIVSLGLVLFVLGLIMLVTPGPGIVFLILGLGLMAAISERLAHGLDRLESFVRERYRRWRSRNRQ